MGRHVDNNDDVAVVVFVFLCFSFFYAFGAMTALLIRHVARRAQKVMQINDYEQHLAGSQWKFIDAQMGHLCIQVHDIYASICPTCALIYACLMAFLCRPNLPRMLIFISGVGRMANWKCCCEIQKVARLQILPAATFAN